MKTSLPLGQGDFLTGTRKELSWAKARQKGFLAKGEALVLSSLSKIPLAKLSYTIEK